MTFIALDGYAKRTADLIALFSISTKQMNILCMTNERNLLIKKLIHKLGFLTEKTN